MLTSTSKLALVLQDQGKYEHAGSIQSTGTDGKKEGAESVSSRHVDEHEQSSIITTILREVLTGGAAESMSVSRIRKGA